ncbi:Uncharacterised protein [Vibrio cholerae]|nr:Uncharacterised protein [Vibrio cholerae]
MEALHCCSAFFYDRQCWIRFYFEECLNFHALCFQQGNHIVCITVVE